MRIDDASFELMQAQGKQQKSQQYSVIKNFIALKFMHAQIAILENSCSQMSLLSMKM